MKKPIAPTIYRMEVGDVEAWPIDRYDSVRISTSRANIVKRAEGRKYSLRVKDLTVEVVRTA